MTYKLYHKCVLRIDNILDMNFKIIPYILSLVALSQGFQCVHDQFIQNQTNVYYDDRFQSRFLTQSNFQPIRIFVDWEQVRKGTASTLIKKIMSISINYYHLTISVQRKQKILFPTDLSRKCQVLSVPQKYQSQGIVGDLAIMVGSQHKNKDSYVAKSASCAQLLSTGRPYWGMILFNEAHLSYKQHLFQQFLLVGMHQMFHILGFSAKLYDAYPKGNPYTKLNGQQYLSSPEINREVKKHFGCDSGMLLQDQDGSLVSSHWEKKVMGNQFMVPTGKLSSYISAISLAVLESTGWYTVNYQLTQSTTYGKDKGCAFIDRWSCNSQQFCNSDDFRCNWEGVATGSCQIDKFAGQCKFINYYSNTICIDPLFHKNNLNRHLQAKEKGGSQSHCFASDFRKIGTNKTELNTRCYISICSSDNTYLYIMVEFNVLVCSYPGEEITAPNNLEGTLICPSNFANYCQQKKLCPNHCSLNGLCINGKCLCVGKTQLTSSGCLSQKRIPDGLAGALILSRLFSDPISGQKIILKDLDNIAQTMIKEYQYYLPCLEGTFEDSLFGECLPCSEKFGCASCTEKGCIICDNGQITNDGIC